ncbi:MAG: RNA-binding S4 domain-containing protein [Flavobacteriia bacterium]|nr:RNA-binding S4 domain-containing protein [Flavobacteriia bacterium]
MRIDKFIWCVRLAKTRSLASEWIQKELVQLNNEVCKPSRSIQPQDLVSLKKLGIWYSYRVLDIPKSRMAAAKVPLFLTDETAPGEREKEEFLRIMKSMQRDKGSGRPTKKDRRDIDRLSEEL